MTDVARFRALDVVRAAFSQRREDSTVRLEMLTGGEVAELESLLVALQKGRLDAAGEERIAALQWRARRREELGLDIGPVLGRVECVGGGSTGGLWCGCLADAFSELEQEGDREVILARARVLHGEREAARQADVERLREGASPLPAVGQARRAVARKANADAGSSPARASDASLHHGPSELEDPPPPVEATPPAEVRFVVDAAGNRVELGADGKPVKARRAADGRCLPRGSSSEPTRSPKWFDPPPGDGLPGAF